MRRGISPVITSTLLVLVSITIVAIFYTWATSSTTLVSSTLYADAQAAQRRILSSVKILAPPPENLWDTNQVAIIHNNGELPLTDVKIMIAPPGTTNMIAPKGLLIRTDGNTTTIASGDWPIDTIYPGDAILIWLPEDNYDGYTIIVVARNFERSKVIGAVS